MLPISHESLWRYRTSENRKPAKTGYQRLFWGILFIFEARWRHQNTKVNKIVLILDSLLMLPPDSKIYASAFIKKTVALHRRQQAAAKCQAATLFKVCICVYLRSLHFCTFSDISSYSRGYGGSKIDLVRVKQANSLV